MVYLLVMRSSALPLTYEGIGNQVLIKIHEHQNFYFMGSALLYLPSSAAPSLTSCWSYDGL
jgi:hypothetical protein